MGEQDYTRRRHGGAQEEIKEFRVETQSAQARCLTAREPLEKTDERWKMSSTADSPKSPFPIAMGGTFVWLLVGRAAGRSGFSAARWGEFFCREHVAQLREHEQAFRDKGMLLRPLD
jgi:hypothetical protein